MKKGILLPIFSLPSRYGIGTLGQEVYNFIDFLALSHQSFWQILPTNPTSYKDSPYQGLSIYGQNPYFIDLELLVKDKLITKKDLLESNLKTKNNKIDYGNLFVNKIKLLKKSYDKKDIFKEEFASFKIKNKYWLDDYAIFMVLKEIHNYVCWNKFEDKYKYQDKKAIKEFKQIYHKEIDIYKFIQFLYFRQWNNVLKYAHQKHIKIIGDMPIYVAYDSVDVWKNPKLFMLDEKYNPTLVAGVPPDYFSKTGQLWGNPIYNYDLMKKDNYRWWINRIKFNFKLFDYVRIDHFRGFSAYYAINANEKTAINGKWYEGPGFDLFKNVNLKLNYPKIIAENLGLLDDNVNNLIKECNYPGMRILQFEMYDKNNIENLKHLNKNNVIYSSTHDNNTFIGWYKKDANKKEKEICKQQLGFDTIKSINEKLLKYIYSFDVNYVILPLQDIIGLDEKARINLPGTDIDNWTYMFNNINYLRLATKYNLICKERRRKSGKIL